MAYRPGPGAYQHQRQQRHEQPQRRARSTMEMSQSREITGISALDEETSHLQQSRGGARGGRRSQSQSSWNEGPAERARRELERESSGQEYYYDDDGGPGGAEEEVIDDAGSYTVDDRGRETDQYLDTSPDQAGTGAEMVVDEEEVASTQ